MEDYYQILGITPRATQQEVRRSFRKLAVLYHPDKNSTPEAEERFKEINRAYEILNNEEKRARYDLSLAYPNTQSFTQPPHRDPAYRRRQKAYNVASERKQGTRDLMAEYLPKFRWACWAGLVICFLLAMDFLLPYKVSKEDIAEINRIYRTGRGGNTIYNHDELITKNGIIIQLQDNEILYFKKVKHINIQQTVLFNKILTAATPNDEYKVRVSSLYGNLIFVPFILLIASTLGVVIRKGVEFPFNLTIVSFLFLLIVLFLLLR